MFGIHFKKAQSTAEYAIVIGLVIAAVVAMQVYVKRGLQGRIKDVVDHPGGGGEVGSADFAFTGKQYEPYYLSSTSDSTQEATETENLEVGGAKSRTSTVGSSGTRQQQIGW
jgi:hypothetical protein